MVHVEVLQVTQGGVVLQCSKGEACPGIVCRVGVGYWLTSPSSRLPPRLPYIDKDTDYCLIGTQILIIALYRQRY